MNEQEYNKLVEAADRAIMSDMDTVPYASELSDSFKRLLTFCEVNYGAKETFVDADSGRSRFSSDAIINEFISFDSVGGSISDYAAGNISYALDQLQCSLVVVDKDGFKSAIYGEIMDRALYPEREIEVLTRAGAF